MSTVDFSKIQVADFATGKGCKTATASSEGKDMQVRLSPHQFYRMPFGASCFKKGKETTRLNLDLDMSGMSDDCEKLDAWALEYACKEKDRLFPEMSTKRQREIIAAVNIPKNMEPNVSEQKLMRQD